MARAKEKIAKMDPSIVPISRDQKEKGASMKATERSRNMGR